jgi:hypothetical protein
MYARFQESEWRCVQDDDIIIMGNSVASSVDADHKPRMLLTYQREK